MKINGLHHVAIICSDYAASLKFYTHVLGFTVLAENFREETRSYKTDLALDDRYIIELFSFSDAPPRPSYPEARGLRHIAFEIDNIDEALAWLDSCGVAHEAVRLDGYTGKRFVFFEDPDRQPIEFYERYRLDGVSADTVCYVERNILPRYAAFDKAHREDHVRMVIEQSLRLADRMPHLDRDMVYVIAAFHDLGLANGRERHHLDSAVILAEDEYVKNFFTPGQIDLMCRAVEDHRASAKSCPRSEYGLVVAEADRFIDAGTIIRRTVQYGLANYPELDRDGHYRRTLAHLRDKYGPGGYLKIWIPWSDNAGRLEQLRAIIADKPRITAIFDRIFDEETEDRDQGRM